MTESPFDLSGKVALVTGGNGGIGSAMAEAMARAGADICIWGSNVDKNAAALETLAPCGVKTMALWCDVSSKIKVDQNFTTTLEAMGRVDGVFANAGISGREGSLLDITKEKWWRMIGVNLDGVFLHIRLHFGRCWLEPRPAIQAADWLPPPHSPRSLAQHATNTMRRLKGP